MSTYRQRFGFTHHPLPKDARGKSFFDKSPGYKKLDRAFRQLLEDPGLGVLTAEAGVGKTAAMRNLCSQLPRPDYLVLYLCDTAVAPLDLYRTLASEIGVRPSHRRSQLWTDLKKTFAHMVDERGACPIVILDEAQHLSDPFLIDLSAFLNFAFDSRDLLTMWLVGLPPLARLLRMQQHAPLAMRVVHQVHLDPLDRELFAAMIEHALKAAGATQNILADPARELLFRACRGIPRVAANLLRQALDEAHQRNQNFIDEHTMEAALDAAPAVQGLAG
jgi:type II secretory pathway predicted ATPase ExeA